jgi:hypothetical protein
VLPTHGLQLRANHREVDVVQVSDRPLIQDNGILNKKIESMTTHLLAIVTNDHLQLVLHRQTAFFQLDLEGFLVNGFEKTRPEPPVHLNSRSNDSLRQTFVFRGQSSSLLLSWFLYLTSCIRVSAATGSRIHLDRCDVPLPSVRGCNVSQSSLASGGTIRARNLVGITTR